MPGIAADQGDRAADNAAPENPVHFGNAGADALFFVGYNVSDGQWRFVKMKMPMETAGSVLLTPSSTERVPLVAGGESPSHFRRLVAEVLGRKNRDF